jgi:hypothetical protein
VVTEGVHPLLEYLCCQTFLKEKEEAFEKFKIFKALTENQAGNRLKAVR